MKQLWFIISLILLGLSCQFQSTKQLKLNWEIELPTFTDRIVLKNDTIWVGNKGMQFALNPNTGKKLHSSSKAQFSYRKHRKTHPQDELNIENLGIKKFKGYSTSVFHDPDGDSKGDVFLLELRPKRRGHNNKYKIAQKNAGGNFDYYSFPSDVIVIWDFALTKRSIITCTSYSVTKYSW